MIKEKVDGNAALINLDQSKAFDRGWPCFSGGCLVFGWLRVWVSHLDTSPLCVPRSHGGGEWGKVGALHSDSIDSSGLPVIAHVVHPGVRAFSTQDKGKPSPTRPHVTWRQWGCQVHSIRWRRQRACNEQCRGGGGEQRNRKVRSCNRGQDKPRKVCRLAVGLVERLCSSRPLHLERRSVQDTRRLVWAWSSIGENWSEVLDKVVAATELWLRRRGFPSRVGQRCAVRTSTP